MKKIIFLLLVTVASYGQTLQNPTYGNVKLKQNTTSATATKVNVQEADGIVNTKPLSEFGTVKSVTGTDGISVANGTTNPVIGISSISQLKVVGLVTDLGNKVDKVTGKSLLSDSEISRLLGLSNYTHPTNHLPSIITQDASNRFVTDTEKSTWNSKANSSLIGANSGIASLDSGGKVPLSQINDALLGSVNYKGTYNASTNSPTLPAASNKGWYYVVSTSGTQQTLNFVPGDWIISNGTAWGKVDNNNAVTSVNSQVGAVSLSTSNIAEGSNLYYTDSRVTNNSIVAANTTARHNAVTIGTANGLSLSTQALSLGLASTSITGALSSTDWNTFNNKQPAGTYATGTGTASGINTGDNATNTQYSGLVSNSTHTGDATGSTALTLATVNANVGTFGTASNVAQSKVNEKGLTTAIANVPIQISESQVTGLITDLANKQPLLTNPITGTGTTNYIAKFTGAGTLTNSSIGVDGIGALDINYNNSLTGGLYQWGGTNVAKSILYANGNGYFAGSLGIGTTTPNNKLTISNGGASGFEFNPANGDIFTFNRQTSLYTPMIFSALNFTFQQGAATFSSSVTATNFNSTGVSNFATNSGNVGIGTTDPRYKFQVKTGLNQNLQVRPNAYGSNNGVLLQSVSDDDTSPKAMEFGASLFSFNGGASTFSSSVTATQFFKSSTGQGTTASPFYEPLAIYGLGTTNLAGIYGGNTFISDNGTLLKLRVNSNAAANTPVDALVLNSTGASTFFSSVTATAFYQSSDIRLKQVIKRDGNVIYFKWKDGRDNLVHIGYSAQQVRKEFPDQVKKGEDGYLSVNYIEVLVAKIQALEKRISELEKSK